jgi:RHS repeat-associated protein
MSQLPITDNDVYGVNWAISAYNGLQKPTASYNYLFASPSITNGSQVRTYEEFTYDAIQRLTDVKHTYALNGAGVTTPNLTLSNMVYNHKDQLVEKNIGKVAAMGKFLQSIDYDYNARGWLTGINSFGIGTSTGVAQQILTPSSTFNGTIANLAMSPYLKQAMMMPPPPIDDLTQANADLFSQNINYNNVDAAFQATPQYNGNISATSWKIAGRAIQGYGYTYDDLDRMTEAKYYDITPPTGNVAGLPTSFSSDFKYNEKLTYDKRGNILTLQRNGLNGGSWTNYNYTSATYGMIDNMNYTINDKNQVEKILDASLLTFGFKSSNNVNAPQYVYDANGNMISDLNKRITNIEYNYLNLPQKITISIKAGTTYRTGSIVFVYDASGVKLRKIVTTPKANGSFSVTTYDYVNGIEYIDNILERIANTEGAVTRNAVGTYEYEYVLRDHLGNTRATFKDGNNDGIVTSSDICQINHYYPFGLNMDGNWNNFGCNSRGNKYQYNGKELNDELGLDWNDYGARFYDAAIGRWNAVDPMSEKYSPYSPYTYAGNNPVLYVDYDGMDWGVNVTTDKNGNINVAFTFTASVLNSSSKSVDMDKFSKSVKSQLEKSFTGSFSTKEGKSVTVSMSADIKVIDSKDKLSESDHLIEIKNDADITKEVGAAYGYSSDTNGKSMIGGKGVMINAKYVDGIMDGTDNNTVPHEIGHTAGLYHPDVDEGMAKQKKSEGQLFRPYKGKDVNNLMYSNRHSAPYDGAVNLDNANSIEINQRQAHVIIQNIQKSNGTKINRKNGK